MKKVSKVSNDAVLQAAATIFASAAQWDQSGIYTAPTFDATVAATRMLLDECGFELETPADHIPDVGKKVETEKVLRVRIVKANETQDYWHKACVGSEFEVIEMTEDPNWWQVVSGNCKGWGICKSDAEIIPEAKPTFEPLVITAETEPTHYGYDSARPTRGRYGLHIATEPTDTLPYLLLEMTGIGYAQGTEWFSEIRPITPEELAKWREENK